MNLGCGTLIVLFALIAAAGKFLPHGEKAESALAHGKHAEARFEQSSNQPPKSLDHTPKNGATKPMVPPKSSQDSKAQPLEPTAVLDHFMGLFKSWVEKNTEQGGSQPPPKKDASEFSKVLETGIDAFGKMAEKGIEEAGGVRTVSSMKAPALNAPALTHGSAEVAGKPDVGPKVQALHGQHEGGLPTGKAVVPGKDAVFNSPWNRSVDQVERYLKHHMHDAASLEILEWGDVVSNPKGYEVRCTYKSKNVLGKWATRTSIFVLNSEGTVTDIKDPVLPVASPTKGQPVRPNGPVGQDRQTPRRGDHR